MTLRRRPRLRLTLHSDGEDMDSACGDVRPCSTAKGRSAMRRWDVHAVDADELQSTCAVRVEPSCCDYCDYGEGCSYRVHANSSLFGHDHGWHSGYYPNLPAKRHHSGSASPAAASNPSRWRAPHPPAGGTAPPADIALGPINYAARGGAPHMAGWEATRAAGAGGRPARRIWVQRGRPKGVGFGEVRPGHDGRGRQDGSGDRPRPRDRPRCLHPLPPDQEQRHARRRPRRRQDGHRRGLAQRVAAGAVPAALAGARVVEVDLGAMVAGTKYRGMFEERVKKLIQEAEDSAGKVVLFIDEVHMLLGAGQGEGGAMDGANLLKPALARGRIRCVGATTFDEHRKYVEKDAALERRFQKVHVQEPSMVATIAIMQGLKTKYEEHHGRQFPDKAIDLIDEACATARMHTDNRFKGNSTQPAPENAMKEAVVCPSLVAQVVSRWTGIPVNTLDQNEKEKLVSLSDRLRERVVGQEEAVNLVAQAVLRSRFGFNQPGKPIGSFLFLGSTGVGKTELAKALAEQLFDSEKMLIRFDMTEFVGAHSVMRLSGAPPSYRGHEDGGQLTEKVRQRPYSVILFDEIEKADKAVFNLFLQLLDDGVLTDGKGRTVDFKNTIIIMTSNLGAEYLMEAMTGEKAMEAARDLVIREAQKYFRPEFLNRLSELVIFEPLSRDRLREIANIQMKGIIARVADKGITLSASDAALDVVLSKSHNPLYGARPIRRWLQKNVMTKLCELLVKGDVDADTTIDIDASEDKEDLKYDVVNAAVRLARRLEKMPIVDYPSDTDRADEGLASIAKKSKVVTISSTETVD
ncbi:hypothetical protein ACP4OV_005831 [Aristida adscensionis]